MNGTETYYFTIALSPNAHNKARQFADEQVTEEKNRQVYRNTLAVYAVHKFVQEIGFETDLDAGDSWHSVIRTFHNVADLVIPNLGKIECRPVMPEDTAISLPPEVTEDRIAYVGVRFQEQLDKVELLGFIRSADVPESSTTIEFEQLEPIENLIDYLFRLESGIPVLQEEAEVNEKIQQLLETTPMPVIISQLEYIFRSEPEYEWRAKGGKVMLAGAGAVGGTEREFVKSGDMDEEIAAQDLAEDLLERLAEIWGDEE